MSKLKESEHLKIPFREIERATNNFETCIGKGGYGRVYKGKLFVFGNLTTVAVKRLYEQFGQGSKEFLTEIALLSGQKHPNLISLLGYCEEGKEKIIVYEYVERGSLDQYLVHGDGGTGYVLTWLERLTICVDIARGLDHLHNHVGKHQTIIHRDIKSSNILLDHNWVAKISDLGLSKLCLAGLNRSAVISHACGTPGYCEPEYIDSGIVKKESDVYSFGVVLLEILSGRLCTIRDDDGFFLLHYYKKNKLDEITDPSIRKQTCSSSIAKFLLIAYGCLNEDRGRRFPINLVVLQLEKLLYLELNLCEKIIFTNDDEIKSELLMSIDDLLQDTNPSSCLTMLLRRGTNVWRIFRMFDLNKDGGLSREELTAFLGATNVNIEHGPDQISTYVDEVLSLYKKYLDGKKGLTYLGLLQYYIDGLGDLDSDIMQLASNSYLDDDDDDNSSRRLKFLNFNHDLADDGPLKLALVSKPSDDDLQLGSPKRLIIMKKPWTHRPAFLWLAITLLTLLITIIVRLAFLFIIFYVLSKCYEAFMNKIKKMKKKKKMLALN